MEVIISSFGAFGSESGGGNTGFEVAQYLWKQNALKRVLCSGFDSSRSGALADYIVRATPKWSKSNVISKLVQRAENAVGRGTTRLGRIIGEQGFDKASVRHLVPADLMYCIKPVVPETIAAARKMGIITTAQTATCHARFNLDVIDRERSEYNLPCIDTYCDEARVRRMEEVYAELDWIITWSDTVAQTFLDYGVPRDKIRVLNVPLGLPKQVDIIHIPGKTFEVLYVAHTNLLKGLHYLLEAWERRNLSRLGRLTICGAIDANTVKIINRKGLGKGNVEFVGPTKPARYYERADVVVVPSLSEGDSAVPREAMAYGIPVIVTDKCGNREVIEQYRTGLVVPARNWNAIGNALLSLYESPDSREQLGANGRKAASIFSWEFYSRRLYQEFEVLCGKVSEASPGVSAKWARQRE